MSRGRWIALAALVVALILPGSATADWAPVQSSQLNTGQYTVSVAATSLDGIPYFAWAEGSSAEPPYSVYVDKVSGGSATTVGGGAVGSCSADPQIGVVGTSLYLACYSENDSGIDVYELSGSTWTQVGKTISSSDEVQLSGMVGDGSTPTLAFVDLEGTSEVVVEQYVSGAWGQVGSSLVHTSGNNVFDALLLADGTSPIITWLEEDSTGPTAYEMVYADKMTGTGSGASFTPLDNGASLVPTSSTDVDLDSVALVGSTPYVAFDEQPSTAFVFDGYVVPLTGSATPLDGPVASGDEINPQIALGSDGSVPLALVQTETPDGDYEVTAESPSGSAWGQVGSQLGVPPLPGSSGDGYPGEAITDDASGAPYVGILQQPSGGSYGEANLFVENDSATGVNPNHPFDGNPTPPTKTTGTATSAVIPSGVVLSLSGPAGVHRHGKRVTLDTAITARCPAATAFKSCTGSAVIRLTAKRGHKRTAAVKAKVSVKAGRTATIDIALSSATIKKLGGLRRVQQITGKVTITLAGPNKLKVSLGQSISARLG